MVSKLAKSDFERLQAQGLKPTLEDFDRLNQLAVRLTDGKETTNANFPRIGWAGDAPFFEPTLASFAWYYGTALPLAANPDTEDTFWAFSLAHARTAGFFDALTSPRVVSDAVAEWVEKIPATREEVLRACRYAAKGFDDAVAANPNGNPAHRATREIAAENLSRIEAQLRAACGRLHIAPRELMGETQSRISAICEAAGIDLGRAMSRDEAELQAEYDLTFREIYERLEDEKKKSEKSDNRGDCKKDGGDDVGDNIPLVARTQAAGGVAGCTPSKEPEEVVVVVHGEHDTTSGSEGKEK